MAQTTGATLRKTPNYLEKDNTTSFTPTADYQPSTKKYVDDSISNLVNGADAAFDTLKEIQDAMATDTELATAISNLSIPTKTSDLTNDSGFITGIDSTDVTTALGYTPYNATNPSGFISDYTVTSSDVTTALGYTPYNATNPSGYISGITSSDVTTALGFTPYNATNPSGYITGITSGDVTTALGYTPYNATNPSGYISDYTVTKSDVDTALGTAAANDTYFYRGDGTWAAAGGSDGNDYITGGSFNTTTGELTLTGTGSAGATIDLDGKYAESSHSHTLSNITDAGTVAAIDLNSSTTNYLRGDGTWVNPPGSYLGWDLQVDSVSRGRIDSGEDVNIVGGTDISLDYSSTNNTITINSTAGGGGGIAADDTEWYYVGKSTDSSSLTTITVNEVDLGAAFDWANYDYKFVYQGSTSGEDSSQPSIYFNGISTTADKYSYQYQRIQQTAETTETEFFAGDAKTTRIYTGLAISTYSSGGYATDLELEFTVRRSGVTGSGFYGFLVRGVGNAHYWPSSQSLSSAVDGMAQTTFIGSFRQESSITDMTIAHSITIGGSDSNVVRVYRRRKT